jgi:hypothetical protein
LRIPIIPARSIPLQKEVLYWNQINIKRKLFNGGQPTLMKVCAVSMENASGEKECIGKKCLLYMSHPIESYPLTRPVEGKCRLLTYLQSH